MSDEYYDEEVTYDYVMPVYEFDTIEFNYWIIENTINAETLATSNVLGYYPDGNSNFPLAVVNTKEVTSDTDYKGNPLTIKITTTFELYSGAKTDLLTLHKQIEKVMITLGFNRLSPSEPYIDSASQQFKMSESFVIKFNLISRQLERTGA